MPPKPFRMLAWDFDGTLADTRQDIALSINLTLQELGLRTLPAETIFGYIGRGVLNLLKQSLDGTGYEDAEHAVAVFRRHYHEHIMDHTGFYPGCREILNHFSDRIQAIVSNKPREFIVDILQALDCRNTFSAILGGDSVEQRKPHPEALQKLIQEQGIPPESILMIGDSPLDVECGRRAGTATCAVTWGLTPEDDLRAAGPDYLIHTIDELKSLVT